ncbi:MAG: tetratricopeptide repeat protein, partial [Pseudomonadota bacterium]
MDSQVDNASQKGSGAKAAWLLLGIAVILAAGSIGYNIWSSQTSDETIAQTDDAPPSIADLRELAEASDTDARPWSDLAFAHFERGEFGDAAQAYERAVAIDPNEAVLWSALGESLVFANDQASANADPLPPRALDAFEKAAELNPSDPRARYFL